MAPLPTEIRQIIALDLDNFYVGCERLRDPSLVGKPVGIKQKGILATCSYEARAMGVGKLMGLREAKEKCPELIIVLGEDLTPYRRYSRLVFQLVRSIVGPSIPVEKLGMDELFIDCTPLVQTHLASPLLRREQDGQIWFALGEEGSGKGFWYPEDIWAGHRLEDEESLVDEAAVESGSSPSTESVVVVVGPNPFLPSTHLALHLRTQIQTQLGLGTSAGISHTKLLSKLIASIHKPADHTSFSPNFLRLLNPLSSSSSPPTIILHPSSSNLIQRYLDPFPIRKLPGFGHTIVSKLIQHLSSLPPLDPPFDASDPHPPTVLLTRTALSLSLFQKKLFTPRLAPILWFLLHGHDPSPVVSSPDFPNQIGVENSYATFPSFDWDRFGKEVERLLISLVVRLEEELVVEGEEVVVEGGKRKGKQRAEAGGRRWVRWPQKLRLEVRRGWDGFGREGKSVDMPVGVFDLRVGVRERVWMLMGRKEGGKEGGKGKVGGVVGSLMRGLVKEGEKTKSFNLYVINFAALSLSTHFPTPSIEHWTNPDASSSSSSSKHRARPPPPDNLDLSFLNELPSDLRAEVLADCGLSERDLVELLEEKRPSKVRRVEGGEKVEGGEEVGEENQEEEGSSRGLLELGMVGAQGKEEDEGEVSGWASGLDGEGGAEVEEEDSGDGDGEEEEEDETTRCEVCGLEVFPFALAAHALFHDGDG